MINITSKGRYALKIMVDLATNSESGIQQRMEIARRQGIPPDYIDHILSRLKASGLVDSVRGRNGGFCLGKMGLTVTAWDIFYAAEENIYPVRCMESNSCGSDHFCNTKDIWSYLFEDLESSLRAKTLTHLVTVWKNSQGSTMIKPIGTHGECKAPVKGLGSSNRPR